VVEAVHAAGGKIAPQLWHMGPIRLAGTGPHPDVPSISPSGIWGSLDKASVPPDYLAVAGNRRERLPIPISPTLLQGSPAAQ
jgi:2,4-dienoyl-CoA reductase-like NADH-dependent reductase (Old Yellow Enzyme family)